ncbi:LAME_0D04434g1_1 [Lachancea meyersii CBS 8951]|uniref:LAME_0D04434g1_1 n=1 Tax=Lachancea meyersii CBS 8951 TaxID=1266667 RepID=A0A1G4J8L7_9SACH|nr:LAME_0D04434g1_1 [Lachancea meyersii CBS 8951]
MDSSDALVSRVFREKVLKWLKRYAPFVATLLRRRRKVFSALSLFACLFVSVLVLRSIDGTAYEAAVSKLDQFRTLSTSPQPVIDSKQQLVQLYKKIHFDTSLEYPTVYGLHTDLLTVQIGPQKGEKLNSAADLRFYDADPRLVWSVLASHLAQASKTVVPLPFSWYDWADFRDYNKLISVQHSPLNCTFLFGHHFNSSLLLQIETETGERLFDIDRTYYNTENGPELSESEIQDMLKRANDSCVADSRSSQLDSKRSQSSNAFSTGFIVKTLQDQVRPEVYRLQARNYILHTLSLPLSLTVLNGNSGAWQIPIKQDRRENIMQSGLLQEYLDRGSKRSKTRGELDHLSEFDKFAESDGSRHLLVDIKDLKEEKTKAFAGLFTYLQKSDFEFDALAKIEELASRAEFLTAHELSYLDSLRFSTQTHFAFTPKYFQEPGGLKDFLELGRHHDARFFNGAIFRNPDQSLLRLNSMMITFQAFLKANHLTCWLAHGSLFGYLYNGLNFPWDNDFDVQMPIRHLHILAQNFNQSLILQDPREGNGRFFLDVGSSITHRIQGNGNNNIDARFIDIDSGLYIDITALSVSSAMLSNRDAVFFNQRKDSIGTELKHRDPNLIANKTDIPLQELYNKLANDSSHSDEERRQVEQLIQAYKINFPSNPSPTKFYAADQRYNLNHELGLYNCRNHHFVQFDMISTLVSTKYHGVSALVPSKYIALLKREYRVPMKSYGVTYQSRSFLKGVRSWIQSSLLRKLMNVAGRHEGLESVRSPANNLNAEDVEILLRNSAKSNSLEFLAYMHNSKEISTYRLKEIELHFSQKYTAEKKHSLLIQLYNEVGSRLKPIMKDPFIRFLQDRKWNELSSQLELSSDDLSELNLEFAESVIAWNSLLDRKDLPFLSRLSDKEAGQDDGDLNINDGAVDHSIVFKADPKLFE